MRVNYLIFTMLTTEPGSDIAPYHLRFPQEDTELSADCAKLELHGTTGPVAKVNHRRRLEIRCGTAGELKRSVGRKPKYEIWVHDLPTITRANSFREWMLWDPNLAAGKCGPFAKLRDSGVIAWG